MDFSDQNEVFRKINELSEKLFKEQIKISATIELVSGIDYCVKHIDKSSDLLTNLLEELEKRLDVSMVEHTWDDLEVISGPFGLTADDVIDRTCYFFSKNRQMLSEIRDHLVAIMMTMHSIEKQHRRFQKDHEGDFDGS